LLARSARGRDARGVGLEDCRITPHGGTKPDGRPFKTIAIKTPPQAPDDTKLLD